MRHASEIRPARARRWVATLVATALGAALTPSPAAADALVIGDSLGVGVSMVSGLKRLARNSVAIRGGGILAQIEQAPPRSTVFMSLGTNDAVGRVEGLDAEIGQIVAAARRGDVKLVWIGPPCVTKDWDSRAAKLDGILRARTAGTAVTYVGTRDASLCSPALRAKDGVHFTARGYGLIWAKAAAAAGLSGTTRLASAEPLATASSAELRSPRRSKARAETRLAVAAARPDERPEPAEPQSFGDWLSSIFLRPTAER